MSPTKDSSTNKPKLVIIGSGWAGFELARHIRYDLYDVTVLSPHRNTTYTPLLASAATGHFNFSLAEDPVRSKNRKLHFLKVSVSQIDFENKECICTPAFKDGEAGEDEGLNGKQFPVQYDVLAICPGLQPNDFGTPGVAQHGIFMRTVTDAMRVRKRLFELLEKASLPTVSSERAQELLHIAIVGGGPTGIELTAELDDMCKKEILDIYPDVAPHIKISVYDVAPNILPVYDAKLHEYATAQLEKRDINVSPNTKIESVDGKALHIKEKGRVPYGMLLWVTGNKNVPLVEEIDVRLSTKPPKRIVTDDKLQVYKGPTPEERKEMEEKEDEEDSNSDSSSTSSTTTTKRTDTFHPQVYALGDCSVINTNPSLPPTAEVACQQAKYLATILNSSTSSSSTKPFTYTPKTTISYIGSKDGVISGTNNNSSTTTTSGDNNWTGSSAWMAWRGANLGWVRTRRGKVGILVAWCLNALFGREITML